jgi:hypothetical protein
MFHEVNPNNMLFFENLLQCPLNDRYHEHEVEDDVANCVVEQERKCSQVTQGYTSEEQCTNWPVKKCSLQREVVKKYTPETDCKKNPYQLCGPSACPVEPGPEQCQDKTETVWSLFRLVGHNCF